MPTATHPEATSPKLASVRATAVQPHLASVKSVEIFQSGVHRDKSYTDADLDVMCENFERLQSLIKPPVVVGHSEDQSFLEDSGIPAAGTVTRLWRDGHTLFADFAEMPLSIARLVNGRAYRSVSAEVYDDFADNGRHYGKTLRRVALLGGELPQIKRLQDLPMADYSERPGRTARLSFKSKLVRPLAGTVAYFSEIHPVAKRTKLAKFSERCKATWRKFADEPAPEAAPEGPAEAPAGVTRDDMVAMLAEMGADPAVLEKVPDDGLAEMIRLLKSSAAPMAAEGQEGEAFSGSNGLRGSNQAGQIRAIWNKDPDGEDYAEAGAAIPGATGRQPSQVTLKFGEREITVDKNTHDALQLLLKPLSDQLTAAQNNVEKFAEAEKRKSINSRLDVLVRSGKVLPAETDGLRSQLYRANGVAKFSDGLTELDKQLALLEARPNLVKFSETVKSRGKGHDDSGEKQKVEQFAEQNPTALKAAGKTPASFVAGFLEARKKKPELTAREYGIPASYDA